MATHNPSTDHAQQHLEADRPISLRGAVVLETDVNGLGAIRSLKELRPSPPLVIGVDFTRSIGFHSRLCRMVAAPPPHVDNGNALTRFLIRLAQDVGGHLALFPCGDRTVRLCCNHREALSRHYRILLPHAELVESLINKSRFAELAARIGTAAPPHAIIEPSPGAAAVCGLRFPIIAKPLNLPGDDPVRTAFKAKVFDHPAAWDAYFADWSKGGRVLVQERIVGDDTDIFFYGGAWIEGRPICGFTGRKLRQHPRGLGSTVMAACERNETVRRLAEQFLRDVRFTGLCDVEFKHDRRDHRHYIIEVNPRQGQWHRISRSCGIDLIQAAYLSLAGVERDWPAQPDGCSGYWSYQFQDVARLVDDWRHGDRSVTRWFRPYLSMPQDGVFNWRDPRPWAMEFAGLLRRKLLRQGATTNPKEIAMRGVHGIANE